MKKSEIYEKVRLSCEQYLLDIGEVPSPALSTHSRNILTSNWGKIFLKGLAGMDYSKGRLSSGRSYFKNGLVYNVAVEEGVISGYVGLPEFFEEQDAVHHIRLTCPTLDKDEQEQLLSAVHKQGIGTTELILGKVSEELMKDLIQEDGLIPGPYSKSNCPCLDDSDFCAHVGALMYGAATVFERSPMSLFQFRGFDAQVDAVDSLLKSDASEDVDFQSVFGIEVSDVDEITF